MNWIKSFFTWIFYKRKLGGAGMLYVGDEKVAMITKWEYRSPRYFYDKYLYPKKGGKNK